MSTPEERAALLTNIAVTRRDIIATITELTKRHGEGAVFQVMREMLDAQVFPIPDFLRRK